MKVDTLVMHSNDIGQVVGDFYGTAIRAYNPLAVEVRELVDAQIRIRMSLGEPSAPIELLPNEVITNNIIRRSTAAEVVGEDFYDPKVSEGISGLKEANYYD